MRPRILIIDDEPTDRYPYLLSGITFCKTCGDRMAGKSAHGTGGKIGYYEHSWSTKAGSVLSKKLLHCDPPRIQAKLIEPVVWDEIRKFLMCDDIAKELIKLAKENIQPDSKPKEIEKLKNKLSSLKFQMEALAERLSQMPKGLDPKPIFDQMTKIQTLSIEYDTQIKDLQLESENEQTVVDISSLSSFIKTIRELLCNENNPIIKSQIIHKIVSKILVTPDGMEVHFHIGQDYYKRELDLTGSRLIQGTNDLAKIAQHEKSEGQVLKFRKRSQPLEKYLAKVQKNTLDTSSNSLTNGGGVGN